jgi:O-antigen/teichoic acid export membrane protein
MRQRLKNLLKSSFARSVLALVGGTAIAQALGILALPFLTRLYTPADFGILAVFAALLGMISIVACFRYEIAIPLPEHDKDAANLLVLALCCLIGVTSLVIVAVLFFSANIAVLMKAPVLAKYLWLLPLAIFATSSYGIFQFWATRKKAFGRIARTRIEQSICGVSTQLTMGWYGFGALGLIVGQVVNNGAGVFGLARRAYKDDHAALKSVCYAQIKTVAKEYSRFPKYSTFEALANSAGIQIPIILIASLSTSAEAGYLMLAMRIMQAPMSLIGSSISQVYFSRAVDEHRNGSLGDFTARVIGQLAKVGIAPMLFMGIISPVLFGYIFGLQWSRAGELVAWMTPWFVLQFLAAPISMSLHVTGNQRKALLLTAFGLILRVSLLYVGAFQLNGHASESYAISGFVFYFVCLLVFCNISNVPIRSLYVELKSALPVSGIAVFIALCVKYMALFWFLLATKSFSIIYIMTRTFDAIEKYFIEYYKTLWVL